MENEASVTTEVPVAEPESVPEPPESVEVAETTAEAPAVVPDQRIAELEAENGRLQSLVTELTGVVKGHVGKIERLRAAKNAYRDMAARAPGDMAGAHSQGDIYSSRRKVELANEFAAIKDEE